MQSRLSKIGARLATAGALLLSACGTLSPAPPPGTFALERQVELHKGYCSAGIEHSVCSCVTAEIEHVKGIKLAERIPVNGRSYVEHAWRLCTADFYRDTILGAYTLEMPSSDLIRCFTQSLYELSDEEVVDDALASRLNSIARRRDPTVEMFDSKINQFRRACENN